MKKKFTQQEIDEFHKECTEIMKERRMLRKYMLIYIGTLLTILACGAVLIEMGYTGVILV